MPGHVQLTGICAGTSQASNRRDGTACRVAGPTPGRLPVNALSSKQGKRPELRLTGNAALQTSGASVRRPALSSSLLLRVDHIA